MQPRRAAFAFIFVTAALDSLALGVIIPVLPALVLGFEGGDGASAATWLGIFGSVFAGMQFLFAPLLGSIADRFGRRPVVLLANFGMAADYAIMALSTSVGWLLVGRILSGLCGATWTVAGAYIADVTPAEQRASRFGILNAAFGFGFVTGPVVGAWLGALDPRMPFWFAGGLSLANALYGTFVLPESLAPENRAPFHWRVANPVGALGVLRRSPVLLGLATAGFLADIAHEVNPTLFVLYTDLRYGWGLAAVGLAMATVGISSALVGAFLVGPLVARLGTRRAVVIGLAVGSFAFLAQGFATSGRAFALAIPLLAMWAIWRPAAQQILTAEVGPSEQGRLQGAIAGVQGIAFVIGPILLAQVFARSTASADGPLPAGAPFLLAGLLLAVCAVIGYAVTRGRSELSAPAPADSGSLPEPPGSPASPGS
jgi:DHA1 family tetracycline resistance protein-like MFS transporter